MTHKPKRFVLTGGPCGLKSTALVSEPEKLRDMGYQVFVVKEVATRLMLDFGFSPESFSTRNFQQLIFSAQRFDEGLVADAGRFSRSGKPRIYLFDRGLPDQIPYAGRDEFMYLLERHHRETFREVLDHRYDAVYHMRSVAYDKPDLYRELWQSNPVRRESTPELARDLDERTLNAWNSHEHLTVIGNYDTVDEKLQRLHQCICHDLGVPVPLEKERKFHVASVPKRFPRGLHVSWVSIEQAYLSLGETATEERVRCRSDQTGSTYSRTRKRFVRSGVREEWSDTISLHDYYRALAYRDTDFAIIRKRRHCFVWKDQYFTLDSFDGPEQSVKYLLEVELTDENESVELPPFLNVVGEVTDDPRYTNREIARIR